MDRIIHGVAESDTTQRLSLCHKASFSGQPSIQRVVCIHCLFLWVQLGLAASMAVTSLLGKDLLCGDGHSFLLGALESVDGHKAFPLSDYVLNGHCAPGACEGLGIPWLHEYSR